MADVGDFDPGDISSSPFNNGERFEDEEQDLGRDLMNRKSGIASKIGPRSWIAENIH